MEEMTMARLNNYRTIERQIEMYNQNKDNVSFLSGVNTAKPSVQNSRISDTTADIALSICETITEKEYQELCEEYHQLKEYISNIADYTVREIAKYKFVNGLTYDRIAEIMKYEISTIKRKLYKYIKSHKNCY